MWGMCGRMYGVSAGKMRGDVGKDMGEWEKVRGDVSGVKKCGGRCERVYGVSVGKCVGVWRR